MNSQGKCAAATANAPLRNSGLEPIGDLPWGTHFCKFYTNRAELVETLVRYFKAGLEANEFCLWVTSEPLRADEATNALRKAVPGLDQFIADGQIEILDNSHWRTLHGDCDADRVLDVFCSKLDAARQRGFEGLRLSGDRSWLACNDRDELTRYEARMNSVIGSLRVLALCTCALEECTPREALDLVGTHEFALIRDGARCRVLGNLARLKAERELKESREDLARAQAVAQTGSWRLDVNHNALTWSAETFRIFGLPRGTPLTYETFLSAVHPDDREYVDRNWQAALQGAPYDIEHRILVDGQTKWVRERAELEFDEQGRLLGGFGTVQDITAKKQSEEALRESEAWSGQLVQGIAQDVWETDPHGAVTQDSPSWRASTGQTLEEWRGYGWLDAIHPEDRAQVERQWREAVAAGRGVDTEYRLRCASGGWRWTGVRTVPVHDDEGRILKWIGMNVDIHARKQAEAALRESERKYREKAEELGQIMEVVPAAIFVSHDPECREIFGNRLANEFYEAGEGENVSAGPVGTLSMTNLKRRFSNLKGRELSPFELPMQRAASKNSLLQNEEMVVSLPCGKSFTMLGSAAPLRNADGSVRGSVGAFLDISERKEAEAALEESRGLSEAILDSLKSSIAIIDRDGRITAVNAVWQTSREDCDSWLGVNYLSECERAAKAGDDLAGQALRGINEVLNGTAKDFSLEYPCDTPSGPLWFAMTVTPLSGRNSGVVIAHEDITERKQAEDRLRASEERYRGIFQNAGTGITITDLDGRFLSCNPAYTAMLGYTEDELRDLLCPEIVHPEDQETNNAEIRRLLAEEIPAFEMLNRYVAKDGAVLWAHRHVSLLRDAAGRPKNIISLVYDLTERKRREQRIQLLMQEVNHRAKNMLSVVQSIARATAGDEGQEFAQKFEQRIQALSANQSLLISHEWKGIALDELVRSQMAPFADMLDNRIKLSGPPIIIKASASQSLAMALHELATNAGKYGALSASEGVVHIAWHLEPEQGRFKLAWRETGGPEVAPPSRSGFGSVVIGNMIRMNLRADVRLDYAPSGVVWELESPRGHCLESGGEVAHIVEEIGSAKPKASGEAQRRILVVEDEALVGMALAEELRRAGYQVLGPTGSVSGALALLREGCEAAILDVNLGDETSEPIAEKLSREQTPFLAVSGYEHAQLPPAFQNAPLLSKPVRPDIVAKEIDRYLVDGVASEH